MKFIKGLKIVPFLFFTIQFIAGGVIYSQSRSTKKSDTAKSYQGRNFSGAEEMSKLPTVYLSPKEQSNSGITTTKLVPTWERKQLIAYGSVVSIRDLSNDVRNYETAKARLAKAKVDLLVSQKKYERIKNLYKKNLESLQDYQTSQAAYLSDKANVASSQSDLTGIKSKIVEQWGDTISKGIFSDSHLIQNLLLLNKVLIQVSLPSDENNIEVPSKIFILSPQNKVKRITCQFISAAHLANAQFQTRTLYYIAKSALLSGGMNVKLSLPIGKRLTGVVVPFASIIWYHGKAWTYIKIDDNKFIRVEINTDNQSENGFFLALNKGKLKQGAEVVTKGAQLLLSKEVFPAHKSSTEEGDEDND